MPLCLPACARLAIAVSSVALAGLASAQNAFSPGGPDYAIAGALPGDQVLPQAAVNANGGWLVWQDNVVDGAGAGIRAQRLDKNFLATGLSFKVNQQSAGEQEKPSVALLPGGGSVVVWQGGTIGFQKIYARFYGPTGQALTGDVLVNSVTNNHHVTPAVAVNSAGLVLVVWAGFDLQLPGDVAVDRLLGVYGQCFNASGSKSGGEFRINQTTSNNQRSPSVAALADGRFVVGWISEQQRSANSVDVYCRLVSAAGSPSGSAFAVNASTSLACANPSLAASPDGGFLVAWSQNGSVLRTQTGEFSLSNPTPNGWDVFFRHYRSNAVASAAARQLNTFSYGDQFAPKIAAFGRSYLATWISLGQDGSREGIFGQFFNSSGAVEGVEFGINTTAVSRQIHPAIATDGVNRFMVAWASFNAGTSFDLVARAYDIIRMATSPVGGGLQLSWNTIPGNVYQVQTSVNLGAWANVGSEREAAGFTDSVVVDPGVGSAIFRVVRVR